MRQSEPSASSSVDWGLPSSMPLGGTARSLSIRWRAPISIISTRPRMPTLDHMLAITSSSALSLTMVPVPA